ncbi:phosphatidylglycerophosphatase A [bacterium]|nr:phosphatidylglycerophosphatase A [bacterium]
MRKTVSVFIHILATTFFSGHSKIAPGTAGSLVALILYLALPCVWNAQWLAAAVLLFLPGVWVSTVMEKKHGHDAHLITIDEWVGTWLTLGLYPGRLPLAWSIAGFLLFRVFDIIKPFPAGRSQNLPRGWGVMMDDVLAAVWAHVCLRILLGLFT